MHLELVGLRLFVSSADSCASLNPTRELWSRKGRRNRIRHVDPEPPGTNLFQILKLTLPASVYDPDPRRRSKMCNCQLMRAPRLLECVTVTDCEKLACQSAQLSTTLSADLHLAFVGLHLVVSLADSCTLLKPNRVFWCRKGWHNRIRHVDPPPK